MNQIRYPYINNPLGFKLPEIKPVIHPIINTWDDLSEDQKVILINIKNAISLFITDFKLILFGSRIKGNWTEDSDWDIIVLKDVDKETKDKIVKHKYDVIIDFKFYKDKVTESRNIVIP
jgi:predicted nucleotidyltransferase